MKSRRLLFMSMIAVLILSMIMTTSASAYVPPGPDNQPYFHIEPDPKYYRTASNLTCTTFDIDVKIYNVSAARPIGGGYEFQLWYNSSLITATKCVPINKTDTPPGVNPPGTSFGVCRFVDGWCVWNPINNSVAPGVGRVWILAIFPVGKTWSGLDATAIRITFHIEKAPPYGTAHPKYRYLNCTLDLNGTVLGDAQGKLIPHGVDDGLYHYTRIPPVGGIWIPINKLELLAPYVGLTTLSAVVATTVAYVKKRKRNTEIDSEANKQRTS